MAEIENRQEEIHSKGFSFYSNPAVLYNKIKVGAKSLDDAILNLGALKKVDRNYCDKEKIL